MMTMKRLVSLSGRIVLLSRNDDDDHDNDDDYDDDNGDDDRNAIPEIDVFAATADSKQKKKNFLRSACIKAVSSFITTSTIRPLCRQPLLCSCTKRMHCVLH